jgi:hypothetical protein
MGRAASRGIPGSEPLPGHLAKMPQIELPRSKHRQFCDLREAAGRRHPEVWQAAFQQQFAPQQQVYAQAPQQFQQAPAPQQFAPQAAAQQFPQFAAQQGNGAALPPWMAQANGAVPGIQPGTDEAEPKKRGKRS